MTKDGGNLKRPIVVLGAARSGTTLLADTILSSHPEIAYCGEPNHVWRYGHAYRGHDVLLARDATPSVKRFIVGRFARFMDVHPGCRFMEKTPSNCFRVPFVLAIFPDAQIVHVLRDGRDVVVSAAADWSATSVPRQYPGEPPPPRGVGRLGLIYGKQARYRDRVSDLRSLLELPAYTGRFIGTLRRFVFHSSRPLWGPRFPGMRSVRRAYSLNETCALQWDLSVRIARNACLGLPDSRYLEVRYESLVQEPEQTTLRILEFLRLERDPAVVRKMTSLVARKPRSRWNQRLTREEVESVERLVGHTLLDLGYDLGGIADSTVT